MAQNRNLTKLNDNVAIFSPSVARIAASTARDWSFVDSWLRAKLQLLPGRSLPVFERNPDTLRALLSLASFSEAADEERQLVVRAEAEALHLAVSPAHGGSEQPGDSSSLRDDLLGVIEDELPKDGKVALEGMAAMAVQAGTPFPEPEDLGRRMLDHQRAISEAEQARSRAETLDRHVALDAVATEVLAQALRGEEYALRPGLAKQNLDQQRRVKAAEAQLPGVRNHAASVDNSTACRDAATAAICPTIQDIVAEEKEFLELLGRKRQLDLQLAAFDGLPGDPEMARAELDALQEQLKGATSRRDAVFEGLVERASPVRRRR